ncbi:proton pump-interactor 1-like isoform X2 [Abrus precatorius]|nr:proton pump-interactor 1-like isoform X2 [Abrus precatorius]XP_027340031.1 proton pump-interactor 1-like isoform X2 [Abrus precatorius]XP_027340032.1 proton pump-interactor 1-like isoform X2 [Abrus precatorius]XP_027340033.1 proton pump-interactor 1-like isoform X2 [Abrus precatorius]XP_027340034.1 proton pump-interactor 1-like isoform X2 [Abrus precatorius]
MAVEVVGFEMVQGPLENGAEGGKSVLHEKESGKPERDLGAEEAIKFGTHEDESAKVEGNDVSDLNAPKDAVEEWPAPKQIHSFYFVRCRPYDDPAIKSKIDQLDKEVSKKNQARFQITEALKAKRSDRAELISQIKSLRGDNRQFQSIVDEKIKEIEPLQQALGKLRNTNNVGRGGLCSSEEELNDVIYSLQYRIQHESISLAEEKQLLREIKQLEGTREKVIANAAMRAKVQESMGQKEAIQDQVKLIGGDLDGVKKERQAIRSKIKQIDDALKTIDKDIQSLQDELTALTQKREKAYESIQLLRKQRDEGNTYFYQSRTLLNKARELAAKKDVNTLDELSQTEVEKFMVLWNSDKNFRNDYEKRILPSLDMRQLSRDGRMRNPDEKPLLEEPKPVETEAVSKVIPKQPKEDPKPPPQENLTTQKESKNKGRELKSKQENKDSAESDEYEFENTKKETPAKEPEVDPAKLKEIKREEEIAKAKQALERKKKLAEKAAAKAALRAQKEAEKKLKDREKKAKKKALGFAAVPNPQDEPIDAVVETTEPEKVNDNVEAPAPVKEKVQKESGIRSRGRARGPDSVPKVILKRKKSNNYWVWVVAAALLVLLFLVLGYTYLF